MLAYERLNAALKFGVIVRSGDMKEWIANVTVLAPFPSQQRHMNLFPLKARSKIDAARLAAEGCARVIYGEKWVVGFVNEQKDDCLFMATIGELGRTTPVVNGRSLSVLIREYASG